MVRPIQRQTDANSGGGAITETDGNTTVYANNLLASVNGSIGTGHGRGVHAGGAWVTTSGSNSVFAHFVPVNYTDNPDSCGDVRVGGSGDVFVGDDIDQDIPSIRATVDLDEEDVTDPGSGGPAFQQLIDSGVVSQREAEQPPPEPTGKIDETPASPPPPLSSDCSDIASLDPFPSGDQIDSIQLTANYTVGRLTRKPSVVFDNPLRAGTGDLSLEEIVCNLKLLAVNCIEPIRAQYPNAFVTNTWRPFKGNPRSQHPKGQAADIQFRGIAKTEYYNIALWIRDNVTYDQLLLEYKTTGTGLPWIHISFDKDKSRKQVLTLLNDKTYSQGLTQLA